jgi:hypothetical protein
MERKKKVMKMERRNNKRGLIQKDILVAWAEFKIR